MLVIGWASGSFLAINYVLPGRVSVETDLYLVQPVLWGGLALLSLIFLLRTSQRPRLLEGLLVLAVLAGSFHVSWLVGTGWLFGFGYSPYSREPLEMAKNGLYAGTLLAGLELSRAYLIAALAPRRPLVTIAFVSLFCALLLIPTETYSLLGEPEAAFETSGRTFLPVLSQGVAASYLAYRGGPLPALVYRGMIESFQWFSPVLPNLVWTLEAFIGTMSPVIAVLIVRGLRAERGLAPATKKDVPAFWVVSSMAMVLALWFNTGMLGVQPSVVSGVSMEPAMALGDLAITQTVDPDSLAVGDIVRYDREGVSVVHRIVEIDTSGQAPRFVTKGDNNNTPDDPITADQIEGKVVLVIPGLGWVPIRAGEILNGFR